MAHESGWLAVLETLDKGFMLFIVLIPDRENGSPPGEPVADEAPDYAPEQIRHEHITDVDMHGLQQDLAIVGDTQGIVIEQYGTYCDQAEDAQNVEPMK
jgi:hypothetical protein